jgi:hypothetical protein
MWYGQSVFTQIPRVQINFETLVLLNNCARATGVGAAMSQFKLHYCVGLAVHVKNRLEV